MTRFARYLLVSLVTACATEMPSLSLLDDVSPWRLTEEKQVQQPPVAQCYNVAPGYNLHAVVACETEMTYVMRIGDQNRTYAKAEMQQKLRTEIYYFLRKRNYPLLSLKEAVIEVWVFAPTFDPLRAEFRALLISKAGNVPFTVPIELVSWEPASQNVSYLGSETYPEIEKIWYPRTVGTETRFFAFRFFS